MFEKYPEYVGSKFYQLLPEQVKNYNNNYQ